MLHTFSPTRLGLVAVKHCTEAGRKYLYLYAVLFGMLAALRLLSDYSSTAEWFLKAWLVLLPPVALFSCIAIATGDLRDAAREPIAAMLPATSAERFLFLALHTWILGFLLPGVTVTCFGVLAWGQLPEALWQLLPLHPLLLRVALRVRRNIVKGYAVLVLLLVAFTAVAGKVFGAMVLADGGMVPVYDTVVPGLPARIFYARVVSESVVVNLTETLVIPAPVRTAYAVLFVCGLYAAACRSLRERRIA